MMKTLQHIKELYQSGEIPDKNLYRLANFIPIAELADFGIYLSTSELSNHILTDFTKSQIIKYKTNNTCQIQNLFTH